MRVARPSHTPGKSALHRYCIDERGGGDCGSHSQCGRRGGRRVTAGSLHAVNFLRMVATHAHHARLCTVNKGNTTAFLFAEYRKRGGEVPGPVRSQRELEPCKLHSSFIFPGNGKKFRHLIFPNFRDRS